MEGTTNSDIRINNRKRMVNILFREGAMSKQQLATKLNLSMPTVTLLLKELMNKGMLKWGKQLESTGGRKPLTIMPVYNKKYSVGVELTLKEVRAVVIDMGSNIVTEETYQIELENSQEYWNRVHDIIENLVEKYIKSAKKLLKINIAMTTVLDNGEIVWKKNTPLSERLSHEYIVNAFQTDYELFNSTKTAALAEVWKGNRRGNYIYVSIGRSNVESALIYNSITIDIDDESGLLGQVIKMEDDRTVNEVLNAYNMCEKVGVKDINEFMQKVGEKDETCCRLWDEYLHNVARIAYNLHKILGWKVVIGGGMSPHLYKYRNELNDLADSFEIYETKSVSYIDVSTMGKYGPAIGVAQMPIDHYLDMMGEE